MSLSTGTRLGPYEIRDRLGAGGMGEVYRARDTRLDRTVAIKVLGHDRLSDPQMRARFEREARAIAALNHPHICHLNDIGHHEGVDFLVMEYLEGETLAARLAHGRLPLNEVLRCGRALAEAMAEAHRHGIVHRDLKPGNVILSKTGVKLLDFGLAKLQPVVAAKPSLSTLGPTRESPLTGEGSVLGTWPYMAPEQLEGKEADARTDIFAFGAVLYEMTTGARAFAGDSHASLIAAILEREPAPFADRQDAAPPALERIVRKCLAKRPDARWQSASDLADALGWIGEDRNPAAPVVVRTPRRWPWVAAIVTALALGAVAASLWPRPAAPSAAVRRFLIQPTGEGRLALAQPGFALSLDGRALAYIANSGQGDSLHLRSLDQLVPRPIPHTEGAQHVAFSPDGQWLAFVVKGALKKVSLTSGGPPVTLAESINAIDQSVVWLADNRIVLGQLEQGLFRVSDQGGALTRLTTPDSALGEVDHHFPRPLPGGKALLVTRHLKKERETFDIAVLNLENGAMRVIVPDGFDARYVPTGHLLFARGQALLAAPFDLDRLELAGPPVMMVDRVMSDSSIGAAGTNVFGHGARYSLADDGTLAYIPPVVRSGRRLAWITEGSVEPLPFGAREFSRPSLSPDGQRVAVQVEEDGRRDIWIYGLREGSFNPLTSNGGSTAPTWTPDGLRVTFSVPQDGRDQVYWQRLDGSPAERLVADEWRLYPRSWSPDGRTLALLRHPPNDVTTIGLFDVGTQQSRPVVPDEGPVRHPQISPNGRWLAYTAWSNPPQVHVAALTGSVARRQVTSEGGHYPVWSRDGRRLYYRGRPTFAGTSGFFAVDVSGLPTTVGKPVTILKPGVAAIAGGVHHAGYDVAPDGRLLVVVPDAEETAPLRFEIVLNFSEELKQRVPTR